MFLLELDSDFYSITTPSEQITTCPKCHKGRLKQRAEMRFVSFYQLPLFPLPACQQTYCQRCHKVMIRRPLKQKCIPLFHYLFKCIGTFIISGFLIHAWLNYQQQQEQAVTYLQQPLRHDVWIINNTELLEEHSQRDRFKVYQVAVSDEQTLLVKVGMVEYPSVRKLKKAVALDSLMLNNYFDHELKSIDKHTLLSLKQQGVIESVHRPQNLSLFGGIVMMPAVPKRFVSRHKSNPLNQEAIRLYQNGQYQEALSMFTKAAEQGSAWAQYNLADMHLLGQSHR